ncbi:hypothetical protein CLAFUW4_11229 [Fulvia fulva]|uniref:DUF833-domain-containing protein n=1 Tax=Passalora fulva TaxID=5499 RepID=A0A9Q8US44_PASFU|nr:uncharacterized protein CLAFUR5_10272 [Fulvia fulva]KAK4619936.1 hypothetical protein CLAFUR4_11234 [Fulvia fulva]KAK4620564.1 hypothetical protein CLAFUR0_11239 [Fulvia fulva]UJO20381.1 hypothetical protein CLAFUR5_10272 [Fulvia fulva]WPV17592.1 hypothetical protein CLAFUW4_11229 [Fulvia fulva]WPV32071.1 hypothetical protein CLAFUW7_11225 [Fulvia fulva]
MCISVLSTTHPDYPFILISNRDEFVSRPTLRADWWDLPNAHVLGGRDLQRQERGTWLGITKQGRIAILTNFREEGDTEINQAKSRGAITNSYLTIPPGSGETEEDLAERLMKDVGIRDMGGFTMLYGKLRAPTQTGGNMPGGNMPGLAIISNRTESSIKLRRIATQQDEIHGVSNSHFGDTTWPKVVRGEELLDRIIQGNISSSSQSQGHFVEDLFSILCVDDIPKRKIEEDWDMYVRHMRSSIMIPPAKGQIIENRAADQLRVGDAGGTETPDHAKVEPGRKAYGTTKQTVILVDKQGKVTYVERTLFDEAGAPLTTGDRDVKHEFMIEGWKGS